MTGGEVIRPGQRRPTLAELRRDIDNIGGAVADLMRQLVADREQADLRHEKLRSELRAVRRRVAELEGQR